MRWIALALALVACSGAAATPPNHPDRPVAHDAGAVATNEPVAAVSDRECGALIDHALALAAAETKRGSATTDDIGRASDELRIKYSVNCRAMARDSYACALAAPTLAALGDCGR